MSAPDSRVYTDWSLNFGEPTSKLSRYYLIYWDYSHFCSQLLLTPSGSKIVHQGINYSARLLQGEDFQKFKESKRVCLSFRAWTDSESGELAGVVLVKRAA